MFGNTIAPNIKLQIANASLYSQKIKEDPLGVSFKNIKK